MKKSPSIQSVDRALKILQLFAKNPQLGITEISRELNLSKPLTNKMVITLERNGFLKQDSNNRKYEVGYKAFEVGNAYYTNNIGFNHLLENSYLILRQLMEETMCTAQLGVIERNDHLNVRIIASKESSHVIKISASLGESIPVHVSSAGKCILAFSKSPGLIEKALSKPLEALTVHSITSKKSFSEELEKIRQQGYAVSNEEWSLEVLSIAAPVFNVLKNCIAAILISHPVKISLAKDYDELIKHTQEHAYKLSKMIGFHTEQEIYYKPESTG